MSWLSRLLRPFARLFGGRARRRFEPLDLGDAGAVAPPPSAPAPPPEPAPRLEPEPPPAPVFPELPETAASVEVEEGEDAFEEEERAADLDGSEAALDLRPDLDVIVAERHARLEDTRREAERVALEGEQRVRLTDPAGPGTLAETLARLEREGRVTSRLEDDEGEPVLVYAPLDAPAR